MHFNFPVVAKGGTKVALRSFRIAARNQGRKMQIPEHERSRNKFNYMFRFFATPTNVTSTSSSDLTISFTVSLYFLK